MGMKVQRGWAVPRLRKRCKRCRPMQFLGKNGKVIWQCSRCHRPVPAPAKR